MKEYRKEDIKPLVGVEEHIISHSFMYYGSHQITPLEVSKSIEITAKTLGSNITKFERLGEWWYFCADTDWIFNSEYKLNSIEQVFTEFCPFPELKRPNVFRFEVLSMPFASDVFTFANNEFILLKGTLPTLDGVNTYKKHLGQWARIIGYKFKHLSYD